METTATKYGLTPRQHELLSYIQDFVADNTYSPSYREIMTHFGFTSTASVHKHLAALQRKGHILLEKNSSRSISLIKEKAPRQESIALTFLGFITEGEPLSTLPDIKTVHVPPSLVHDPNSSYILEVRGESLTEEHMLDGDLLIVEARTTVLPGETIIANIHGDDDILVKKYLPEGEYVKLEYASPQYTPLIVRLESLDIKGVVIGLFRSYQI
jgi:repressor LexA